jgi:hypothetical protein
VRISPNEVSFVDKEALIKVYGHSTGTRKVCRCVSPPHRSLIDVSRPNGTMCGQSKAHQLVYVFKAALFHG